MVSESLKDDDLEDPTDEVGLGIGVSSLGGGLSSKVLTIARPLEMEKLMLPNFLFWGDSPEGVLDAGET